MNKNILIGIVFLLASQWNAIASENSFQFYNKKDIDLMKSYSVDDQIIIFDEDDIFLTVDCYASK